ncbi:MAG: hypothetical protein CMJ20_02485 [Phycisphaeraceae bacterium]|nr:hypothetical protein [Phycisphaeraceae bacterium]|tara:strand:- start:1146 stop:1412 length:267 start_codon:yes stop_codon:yes gene_type:complete
MYKIILKNGSTIEAKRPGDVVLMRRKGRISDYDKIEDPELGLITVKTFIHEIEGAANTCATLELMLEDIEELKKAYRSSWLPAKTKGQ